MSESILLRELCLETALPLDPTTAANDTTRMSTACNHFSREWCADTYYRVGEDGGSRAEFCGGEDEVSER